MRFSDLIGADRRPEQAVDAARTPVDTDTYLNRMTDEPRNNGFVSGLVDRRRGRRLIASRRGFLRGAVTTLAATTAATTAGLFGPARRVEAQGGVVGTYPRRILQFCPPYNSGDNCQPGCGSSPICTDCCTSDGYFRNDPANGYTLYAGGCGDGDIADGWIWRYSGKCGNCAEIEYRCSDGYVLTDTGPAPFICRAVTDCVPLADGEEPGEPLRDAARDTNWRPAGALEVAVDQGATVAISGWISDGSGVPVQMRIRSNNAIVHFGTAALARPDISPSRRGSSPNVGFSVSFPTEPGEYEFCVDALAGVLTATVGCVRMNVGRGGSVRGSGVTGSIPPPPVSSGPGTDDPSDAAQPTPAPTAGEVVLPDRGVPSPAPTYGAVQVLRRSGPTTGFVSGWAGDPDTTDAVFIDVQVDGESVATARTDLPRADVRQAFSEMHDLTGFAFAFPLPSEPAEVCVVAVSPDDGRRQPLGCQRLLATTQDDAASTEGGEQPPTGDGAAPTIEAVVYGSVDEAIVTNSTVSVAGWAFDPNARDRVVVVVAEVAGLIVEADAPVAHPRAERIYGIERPCGFELSIDVPSGSHELTVRAVTSDGRTVTIDQRTVVAP